MSVACEVGYCFLLTLVKVAVAVIAKWSAAREIMKFSQLIYLSYAVLALSACEKPMQAIEGDNTQYNEPIPQEEDFIYGSIDLYSGPLILGEVSSDVVVEYGDDKNVCWISLSEHKCEPFGGTGIFESNDYKYSVTGDEIKKVYHDSVQYTEELKNGIFVEYENYYKDGELVHVIPTWKSQAFDVSIDDVSGSRIIDSVCPYTSIFYNRDETVCPITGDVEFWAGVYRDSKFSLTASLKKRIVFQAVPGLRPNLTRRGNVVISPSPGQDPVISLPKMEVLCADKMSECSVDLNNGEIFNKTEKVLVGLANIEVFEDPDFVAYRYTSEEIVGGALVRELTTDENGDGYDYSFEFADRWGSQGKYFYLLNKQAQDDVISVVAEYLKL